MDDFEGFNTSVEKVTEDVVQIAKEPVLEVKTEDMTELLQSRDKIKQKKKKNDLEMESTPSEDAVQIVFMTARDLEY